MTEDDGEWFTDPEHHWQAADLVKCVVSTAAVVYTEHVWSRISKVKQFFFLCIRKQFQCPAY